MRVKRVALSMVAVILWASFVAGCANQLYQALDAKIGVMSYDDAIANWGQPTSITPGDRVFVATWRRETHPAPSAGQAYHYHNYTPSDTPSGALAGINANMVAMLAAEAARPHGEELILTFDKAHKLMRQWRHRRW